jgi:ferredoxin
MRVKIDVDKCCGAGNCVSAAPTVFDQREDDGVVILLQENPQSEAHADVRRATRLCPALAIIIEE